jgi:hypothetical protein
MSSEGQQFVALLSLSMKTLLLKCIPWYWCAELADPVVLSNIDDVWVVVEWCRGGDCCCVTPMAIHLAMPRSG